MVKEKNNNSALYGIIAVLALVIVGLLGYFLGQGNSNTTSVATTSSDTPLVLEAEKEGLNKDDLKKCIAKNKFVDKISAQQKVGADTFGITGTPGNVLINNETGEYSVISGAYPKEAFIEIIDNLLSDKIPETPKTEENTSNKTFVENTDKNTLVLISDKRDSATPIDQLVNNLKEVEGIKNMKIEEYDFSDNGVKEYLEKNKITALPLILFAENKVDTKIDQYITKLNDSNFTLNIGAKFNPFEKLSAKGFKTINKDVLNKIKENSYIKGDKNAKITWLEYSDLECPYCAKLHNSDVKSTLTTKYGKNLNIIFNHFPLSFHKNAMPGANLLECVGELGGSKAFYSIMDYAYKNKIQQ